MYEKIQHCPSCYHPNFDHYITCKDHMVSQEKFALVKCRNCQLIFTNPRPNNAELHKYYESRHYISHTDKANAIINIVYKMVRNVTLKKKRTLIEKYATPSTILDFGCGTGNFLKVCKKSGWKVKGIEPNAKARLLAAKRLNMPIISDIHSTHKQEKFDVITAWHVIEHLLELRKTLKYLKKRMTKEGYLIIALPNISAYDASFYKEHWAAYDVPRHLYHFSQTSLKQLAKEAELSLIDVKPMKLDSYYISLLSEKYLGNKLRYFNAFINGMISNLKAAKNGEYSSLIYILTHKH